MDADGGVEFELIPALVLGADDLDGEIRPADPMRAEIPGGAGVEKDGDVGAAVVVLPLIDPVADVDAGAHLCDPRKSDDGIEDGGETGLKELVLVVGQRRHHVDTLPDLVPEIE